MRAVTPVDMIKALIGTIVLTVLLVASGPGAAEEGPDQVRVVYAAPKNPAFERLREDLQKAKLLGNLREFLSPLRLPRELTIRMQDCDGDLNAWYENDVVAICYDYLAFIEENAANVPERLGISHQAAFIGASLDLVLHEVGHAVFDMLKIPVFGREEDAADMFSAYIMLQFTPGAARQLVKATAFLSATEARRDLTSTPSLKDFANEHALPAQRYFNLLCIAYGSNPDAFAGAVTAGNLPESRAKGCKQEFAQVKYAFATLIRPHVDQSLLDRVRAQKWFEFGDANSGG